MVVCEAGPLFSLKTEESIPVYVLQVCKAVSNISAFFGQQLFVLFPLIRKKLGERFVQQFNKHFHKIYLFKEIIL